MALKPYERKIGSPRSVPLTQVRTVGIPDIGNQIQRAGAFLGEYGLEKRTKEAQEQALSDVAAATLTKDENGNYSFPEPTTGGEIYRETFKQAMDQRFVIESLTDFEERANTAYFTGDYSKDSEDIRQEVLSIADAIIGNAPARLQNTLRDQFYREVRQRDLRYNGEQRRINLRLADEAFQSQLTQNSDEIAQLSLLPETEGRNAQIATLVSETEKLLETRISLGLENPKVLNDFKSRVLRQQTAGALFNDFIEADLPPGEIQRFINVLTGMDPNSTILGYDTAKAIEDFNIEEINLLTNRAGEMMRQAIAEQKANADANELARNITETATGDMPVGLSLSDQREIVFSPNGLIARAGGDPSAPTADEIASVVSVLDPSLSSSNLFDSFLSNIKLKSDEDIIQAVEVARGMQSISEDGTSINHLSHYANVEDQAFIENVLLAQSFGEPDPINFARRLAESSDGEVPKNPTEARELFTKRMPGASLNALIRRSLNNYGIDEVALRSLPSGDAYDDMIMYAAGLAANNVDPVKAVERAAERIHATRVYITPETHPYMAETSGGQSAYVERGRLPMAVPVISNVTGLIAGERVKGKFIEDYSNLIINSVDLPSPVESYRFGENVKIRQFEGQDGIFALVFVDEETGQQNYLRRADTNAPILLDFEKAAMLHARDARNFEEAAIASAANVSELRRLAQPRVSEATEEGPSQGWIQPEPGARERYEEAYEKHLKTFGAISPSFGGSGNIGENLDNFIRRGVTTIYETLKGNFQRNAFRSPMFYDNQNVIMPIGPTSDIREEAPEGGPRFGTRYARELRPEDVLVTGRAQRIAAREDLSIGQADLYRSTAAKLNIPAYQLVATLMMEAGTELDPRARNELGYEGIFQMSPDVQRALGLSRESSLSDQLDGLIKYLQGGTYNGVTLQDTGYKPGESMERLYAAINCGRANCPATARDREMGHALATLGDKWARIREYYPLARRWLEEN